MYTLCPIRGMAYHYKDLKIRHSHQAYTERNLILLNTNIAQVGKKYFQVFMVLCHFPIWVLLTIA